MGITITMGSSRDRLTFRLVRALDKDDLDLASRCLEAGANANGFDQPEEPLPLIFARSANSAKLLIDAGADVNSKTEHTDKDSWGKKQKSNDYPLHRAAKNKHPDVVAVLLEAGADPNVKNSRHDRPLHIAARDQDGAAICQMLIDVGADPNVKCSKTYWGGTPLHWAASGEVADALLRGGADPNARDAEGNAPLHGKCPGWTRRARSLLEAGADVNAANAEGMTPLHWVAAHGVGGVENCKLLIIHGADVNATDAMGNTPLHHAVAAGYVDTCRVLIEAGADIEATNNDDLTMSEISKRQGFERVQALLSQCQMLRDVPMAIPDPNDYSPWDDEGDGSVQVQAQTSIRRF